jgi:hypothetical protein
MSLPFEFSGDDILKIWDRISNYRQKDKNAICLGMYLLNAQILYWYKDINKRFSVWIVKKKIEPSELIEIVECAQSNDKTSLVMQSVAFLNNILARYDSDFKKFRKYLPKNKVERLRQLLIERDDNDNPNPDSFTSTAMGFKEGWMDTVQKNKNIHENEVNSIINWQRVLRKRSSEITELVLSVQNSLNCQQTPTEDLLKRLKGDTENRI